MHTVGGYKLSDACHCNLVVPELAFDRHLLNQLPHRPKFCNALGGERLRQHRVYSTHPDGCLTGDHRLLRMPTTQGMPMHKHNILSIV